MPWLNPFVPEWNDWVRLNRSRAWPNIEDPRRFGGFWFKTQGPGVAPMMGRFVTMFFHDPPADAPLFTEINCVTLAPRQFNGSSGVNALGQEIKLLCRDWDTPHPVHGELGVSWLFTYSRTGFTDDVDVEMFYPWDHPQRQRRIPYDWAFPRHIDFGPLIKYTTSFVSGQDTDWTSRAPTLTCFYDVITTGRTIPNN